MFATSCIQNWLTMWVIIAAYADQWTIRASTPMYFGRCYKYLLKAKYWQIQCYTTNAYCKPPHPSHSNSNSLLIFWPRFSFRLIHICSSQVCHPLCSWQVFIEHMMFLSNNVGLTKKYQVNLFVCRYWNWCHISLGDGYTTVFYRRLIASSCTTSSSNQNDSLIFFIWGKWIFVCHHIWRTCLTLNHSNC